ncbi:glycerophosphodiester phosphodiesterase family protein [Xylophilus sp. Leaf220]|uniref:glycerophosphodiester phosphodiesterase family protein n=1 Tax=Xylophilus sp. Leaf220 TaxID=1735686 RepID=UPI0006F1F226|nr:glycerophosphodiester phosphodiesterase family protein [Xylophilus sp. Leaf220]KQM78186.1 glycerophosphodiester phosphodiesterase [Xylophilus sp. Leaf220]
MPARTPPLRLLVSAAAAGLLATACGGGDGGSTLPTLDGAMPLVIGHRGLPGLFPEETRLAYEAAADAGADSLELDLHLTRDCVLVARHNPWLSDNTNVADVAKTNASVAARKRTVPGRLVNVPYDAKVFGGPAQYLTDLTNPADPKSVLKSLVVDGEDHTGDWSITDFTMAEFRTLIAGTTYDARTERPTELNGKLPIVSFQEVIDVARARSAATGRTISVYPETKNPIWNNAQAIANGCGRAGSRPLEDALLKSLNDNGLNNRGAAVFVQSFDPASLKYLRSAGLQARAVQLVDGNAVDYRTGALIYEASNSDHFVSARPYSWMLAGDTRYFGAMLTPAGLAEIKTYADGIGPWKPQVMAWKVSPFKDRNADGTPYTGALADVNSVTPTALIGDAHRAGLIVHTFTFRNERRYLPGLYNGDPAAEYKDFFRAGIDGVFSDFAGTAVAARTDWLRETGR